MGMYTQIFISATINKDAPADVIHALRKMFDPENADEHPLPDHPLFSKPRWPMIGSCSSFYFEAIAVSKMAFNDIDEQWRIISCSDLKNYDQEIEAFFDWIDPYVDKQPGVFVGFSRFEERDEPTLYFKGNVSPEDQRGKDE